MYLPQNSMHRVDHIEGFFVANGFIPPRLVNVYMWRILCARMQRKEVA